jgi:CopG family nickel-responsive transcriptional regulator
MESHESTVRFTVSLPRALLKELDRRMTARGYASRSELVRDLIREQLVAEKWAAGDTEVVGVLTIAYDHHQRELLDRMVELQHRHRVNILCNTHIHMGHHECLEAVFMRGRPGEIEKLSLEIGGLRGVRFAKLTRASQIGV